MSALADRARATLAEEGYDAAAISLDFEIDLRFEDQDNEVAIPVSTDAIDAETLRSAFIEAYRNIYQYASDDEVETVNIRLIGRGLRPNKVDFAHVRTAPGTTHDTGADSRPAYFGRETGWAEAPVLWRDSFEGEQVGPAIIESSDSTIVVPPSARAKLDPAGNIVVELGPE